MKKGPISKSMLNRLYYKKMLSMQDIASELRSTFPTVRYWMKKHNFSRRSNSDSAYFKANPEGDPFSIKKRLNKDEKDLMLTGLMLYWAEGSKSAKGSIQLANLDHRMLQIFVKFLREVCNIYEEKIRLYVRVYRKFNRKNAKRYWVQKLDISPKKVFVYPHTDTRSKANKQWSRYGIATLQFHNLKLYNWLDNAIETHLKQILNSQPKKQRMQLITCRDVGIGRQ